MKAFLTDTGRGAASPAPIGAYGVVGFISETSAVFDSASMNGQKAAIDAMAHRADLEVEAYLVELTPSRPVDPWTPAVRSLVLRARSGGLRAVVLDHVDRLAADRDDALLLAVTLAECGVRIIEAGHRASRSGAPDHAIRLPRRRRVDRGRAGVAS